MASLDIASQRLHNQHLVGAPFETPEDVVRSLGAVQSQDYAGAKWAIAQRTRRTSSAELDQLFNEGRILRTHILRPTWHFVMPADIRWMLKLTAPRVNAASAYYYRKLELDEPIFRRSNAAVARALEGGRQLTRVELASVLRESGITATGQRLAYLILRAELDAIVCSGALRGKQFTYALLDDRVPRAPTLERDEALAELTRRYLSSHGPARPQDFAWWSGLTVTDAKAGIEIVRPHLRQETVDGNTHWFAARRRTTRLKAPIIHLLPNYDEYFIAYKDHSSLVDSSLEKALKRNTDTLMAHIVVLNGKVVGGWRRAIKKDEVVIKTSLLKKLARPELDALAIAAEQYGRFIGKSVTLG